MDIISQLSDWYAQQCVEEWHEEYGVQISTLDNPGWSLKVDLTKTALAGKVFSEFKRDVNEGDWIVVRRNGDVFEAFGDPSKLREMISLFLKWSEADTQI